MSAEPVAALAGGALSPELRRRVAARASDVDAGNLDVVRGTLRELARDGLLTLGAPGHGGTLREQVGVISELAEECLTTAFCAWSHRMAVEYVGGGALAGELASLAVTGSSAMATGFKAALGLGPLPVAARPREGGLVLNGQLPWASNLHDDAVAVLGVEVEGEGGAVVALALDAPGVDVRPARGLLALEATASGRVLLKDVRLDRDAVVDSSLHALCARTRRPFLILQSAFCLGLARAALAAADEHLDGLGAEFADDAARLGAEREQAEATLAALAEEPAPIRPYVALRLDAAVLAREAVRVEAAVTGGRGYVASSPTGRRLREAAFLPVQSPTEAQLRWELRQSA